MPGIAGLFTLKPRQWAEAQLRRMVDSMRHEPFYSAGTWMDESLGIYIGWVEREHSFCEGMPLTGETGEKILIFSGEEFPAPGTAQKLRQQGHDVTPGSCSYLVHCAETDPYFPASLNGQFQGLLVDRTNGTSTLFNDRYGLRKIYYHEGTEAFFFSAEAKALLEVLPVLRSADPRGLAEFVSCGCVLEDRTLFDGIHVLPCAASWIFRAGACVNKQRYFAPTEWEGQSLLEAEPYYREIQSVFARNLPRYFEGDSIAMSLTGGLDTRAILAWLKPAPDSLPCYTFGGSLRTCRDVRVARRVAGQCCLKHEVIAVGEQFLKHFPELAERTVYLTDGCAGVQQSPDLYVNRIARQIAPIRMTGNYGDQVLRHLHVFGPVASDTAVFSGDFQRQIQQAGRTYAAAACGHALTVATTRQTSWYFSALLSLELSQVAMRTPYLDNDLVRAVYRAPTSVLGNNDLRVRLIEDGDPSLGRIRTDLGFAGRGGRLLGGLSAKLQRFTMRMEYAFEFGDPPWLAQIDRRLSGGQFERAFTGRHRFSHFGMWYRGPLAEYVREMLLDARTLSRPYLNSEAVKTVVQNHLEGTQNHTRTIHNILSLEHIHRLFIDCK